MKRKDIDELGFKLSSAGIVLPKNVEVVIHLEPEKFHELASEFNVKVPNGGPLFKNDQFRYKSNLGFTFKIKLSK